MISAFFFCAPGRTQFRGGEEGHPSFKKSEILNPKIRFFPIAKRVSNMFILLLPRLISFFAPPLVAVLLLIVFLSS